MEKLSGFLSFEIPLWVMVFTGFLIAFGITFRSISTVVGVAHLKNLCARPNERTSHLADIPNLGGIAILPGFVISLIIIAGEYFTTEYYYIVAAIIVLFFIGLKDDILIIDPKKKLSAQIFVAIIISVFGDIRLDHFFEFLNLGHTTYLSGIIMTVLTFLLLINGFNLIDGVDGLSSGVGILSSLSFGIWFWKMNNIGYTVMCFSLAGSLIGFFIFNVFGTKNKIFLGDSGSMLTGSIMSVAAVRSLQLDCVSGSFGFIHSVPPWY